MTWLGEYPEDFATVVCMFTTHAASGAPVAPSSTFEAADIRIYKNGGSAKATSNGVTMTSFFDSVTGLHRVLIDTSIDTGDVGFWVIGAVYTLVLVPDETVDSVAVTKVVGQFRISDVADVLFDRDMALGPDTGSPTKRTLRQAVRFIRNKVVVASGTMTVNKEDDATPSWTATVVSSPTAEPITSIDPAGP